MKMCGLSFLVMLGLAAVAWAEPSDANNSGSPYDVNDFLLTVDVNNIKPIDVSGYMGDVNDPNKVVDPNAVSDSVKDASDPNNTNDTSSGADPNNSASPQTQDSNAVSSYDDSNIHSAADIINPIRLLSGNTNATQSFSQLAQSASPTLSSVTISPASPSASDPVTVTFGGRKGANYVVDGIVVTVRGSLIAVDVTWRRAGTVDGLVGDYTQSKALGKLTAGTHTLQVKNYYNNWPCATITKFFTVSPASTGTGLDTGTGSMWDWLFNSMSDSSHASPFGSWPPFSLD
jgi:hypothetical protein